MLTGVGIAALLIDSLLLFDSSDPLLRLLRGYLIKGVILWVVSFMFGVVQGLRAQRLPVKVGTETMLGRTVTALTPVDARGGKVFVEGEYWNATSDVSIQQGQRVEITAVERLTVRVKPQARSSSSGASEQRPNVESPR
jgi:membrane-bound serine protease (ClpP class)